MIQLPFIVLGETFRTKSYSRSSGSVASVYQKGVT